MKVVVTDTRWEDLNIERAVLDRVGAELVENRDYQGPDHQRELVRNADAVISQLAPLTAGSIEAMEQCRGIVRYGVGVDNVDVAAATRRGIPVCNVPDYCTDEVADHTLTLTLAVVRKLPTAIESLRSGQTTHEPLQPVPRLSTLTFGLYGFGRIAQAVAQRARGFGFRLIATDPFVPDAAFAAAGVERVTPDELVTRSNVLSLHMPLNDETRHMINGESLGRMPEGAYLVNTARGGLVNTDALLAALDSGQLAGAAVDVLEQEPIPTDHPLWQRPNAILTSHVAWYSENALEQLRRSVAEEIARLLMGEPPRCPVNRDYLRHT